MGIDYRDRTRQEECQNCGRLFKIPIDTPLDEVPLYCEECPQIDDEF